MFTESITGSEDNPSEVKADISMGAKSLDSEGGSRVIEISLLSGILASDSPGELSIVKESAFRIKSVPSELVSVGSASVISIACADDDSVFKASMSGELVMIVDSSRGLAVTGTTVIADAHALEELGNLNIVAMLILQLVTVFECEPMIRISGIISVYEGVVNTGVAHHDAVLKLIEFLPIESAPLAIPEIAIAIDSTSAKNHILNDIS